MLNHFYLMLEGNQFCLSYGNGSPNPSCVIGRIIPRRSAGRTVLEYHDDLQGGRVHRISENATPSRVHQLAVNYMRTRAWQIAGELEEDLHFEDLTSQGRINSPQMQETTP
jgi:hypothetical protein